MMRRSVSLVLAILALACFGFGDSNVSGLDELRARAENGEALAQFLLGRAYLLATDGLKKDETAAAVWFRKAADQGQVNSETFLAWMYEEGRGGLAKDDVQAVNWYRKAAAQGEANAMRNLGLMCLDGRGGVAKDDAQGVSWFRKAAEKDDESAENYLGLMYEKGRGGLEKDVTQAIYWYRKAADKGYASAQNNLAVIYLGANPDLRNPRAALDYAQKAVAAFKYNPVFLSTLAAAYYTDEQFEKAVTTQTLAITLLPPDKKADDEARLSLYERALATSKREAKPRITFPTH
jgi:TPR repeat protein